MNPTAAVNLSLIALQAVLNLIAELKTQSGMSDDVILAQAQQISGANDTLFTTLQAALKGATPPPPA